MLLGTSVLPEPSSITPPCSRSSTLISLWGMSLLHAALVGLPFKEPWPPLSDVHQNLSHAVHSLSAGNLTPGQREDRTQLELMRMWFGLAVESPGADLVSTGRPSSSVFPSVL